MQPSATTTFSVTQNLNSESAVGRPPRGPVTVYDSLGNSYVATVNYTNQGTIPGATALMPDTYSPNSTTAAGVTTINYNFGASGATLGTVEPEPT